MMGRDPERIGGERLQHTRHGVVSARQRPVTEGSSRRRHGDGLHLVHDLAHAQKRLAATGADFLDLGLIRALDCVEPHPRDLHRVDAQAGVGRVADLRHLLGQNGVVVLAHVA